MGCNITSLEIYLHLPGRVLIMQKGNEINFIVTKRDEILAFFPIFFGIHMEELKK
jgi:hypothetical protein